MTIQGEGPFTGCRAVFVRLAGCNLQCPGCDTDYTSDRKDMTVSQVLGNIVAVAPAGTKLVVITGGEPFRQNIGDLCAFLISYGYTVQIETNGSLRPSPNLPSEVCVVCSPKTARINKQLEKRVDVYKYVMHHDSVASDGLPVLALGNDAAKEEMVARPLPDYQGDIYLQPMDTKDEQENQLNIKAVTESVLKNGYVLQLQIHKYIGVE